MKAVLALAFAAGALAIPAGWEDKPVKETTTSVDPHHTWEDVPTEPTHVDPEHTWEDVPAEETSTEHTWADIPAEPTHVDPEHTWEDVPAEETSTTYYWGDHEVPATTTTKVTDTVTTYCAKPTTFTHKTDVYTVTEATTLVLTKGPYTIIVPVYEETSTVCDDAAKTWVDVVVPAKETPVVPAKETPVVLAKETPVVPATNTWVDAAVPTKGSPVADVSKPAGPVSDYKGAAGKVAVGGLAGVAAIAALLL